MATANEELFDRLVSHAIYLERYKASLVRRVIAQLNASDDAAEEQLGRRLATIIRNGGYEVGAKTRERLAELFRMLGQIRGAAYAEAVKLMLDELDALAEHEAEWTATAFEQVVPVELNAAIPTKELLDAAIYSRPFQGRLLKEWADGMAPADLDRLERAVKTGVLEGQASEEMVRRIVGTRSAGYADGLLEISRRGAEAVVRTSVAHVVGQAREAVYRSNADIIRAERWTSTLDGRTTAVCRARDGEKFPVGEGPRPPAHWRCRSTMAPILDGVALVGDRPSVRDTRTRAQREVDFRAEARHLAGERWARMTPEQRRRAIAKRRRAWADANIGSVPKETTYEQWLRRQPAAFQDEVLGATKGRLFRQGGLTLDKFVDREGQELTLAELRARDAEAFKRAGLD